MKQISLCITIISFAISCYSQQPQWQWAKQTIGEQWMFDWANSTCIDDENNIYVCGTMMSNSSYFDSIIVNQYGLGNVFIAKYSPIGDVVWVRNISAAVSNAYDICLDYNGDVYVAGDVDGYFTFAGSSYYGNWNSDILLLKYDSNGNEIWAKVIGDNSGGDIAYGISCDRENNIIISGRMNSDSLVFSPLVHLYSVPNSFNAFIAKYNNYGDILWAVNPVGNTIAFEVANDQDNDIIISGFLADSIHFDSISLYNCSFPHYDSYIAKYNSTGGIKWAKPILGNCRTEAIETDLDNNIYVTGSFESQTLFLDSIVLQKQGTNWSDMFIAKYDKDGNLIWAKNAGGTTHSGHVKGRSLTADKYGNIYLTGDYHYQMIIDTVFAPYVFGMGIFIIKYNNIGDIVWIKNTSAPSQNEVYGLAIDKDNNIAISGFFHADSISFGEHTLYDYLDGGNIFVAKLHDTIHTPVVSQEIDIEQGWQLISTYVDPYEPNTDSVFIGNSSFVTIMKDDVGSVYLPQWNINAIGELSKGEGYSIKANTNFTLELTGNQILPELTHLALNSGWGMIAYLRETPAAIDLMLSTVLSNIVMVKNSDGSAFWPAFGINNIGNMLPGEGYQIKMSQASTLTYPAN